MTEELRKEMIKICHNEREQAKVSVRNARRDANEIVRKQKANGEMTEDMMKNLKKTFKN